MESYSPLSAVKKRPPLSPFAALKSLSSIQRRYTGVAGSTKPHGQEKGEYEKFTHQQMLVRNEVFGIHHAGGFRPYLLNFVTFTSLLKCLEFSFTLANRYQSMLGVRSAAKITIKSIRTVSHFEVCQQANDIDPVQLVKPDKCLLNEAQREINVQRP
jgi:hypothetical protein